jgi:hypothetical protein
MGTKSRMTKLKLVADAKNDGRRALLDEIEHLIAQARSLGLASSVYLLSMACLDLKTKIHEINDEELEAFSRAIRSSLDLL